MLPRLKPKNCTMASQDSGFSSEMSLPQSPGSPVSAVHSTDYRSSPFDINAFYKSLIQGKHKSGSHTCISRTHNNARCLTMYGHQCSQSIPVFATKAGELATKSHMLNFCEACAAICCDL